MGFRSTFVTDDYNIKWSDSFKEKYRGLIHFREDGVGCISSISERTYRTTWEGLPDDIQREIDWDGFKLLEFILVFLHESGSVTRCHISKDKITWTEPVGWEKTPSVSYYYY